MIAPQKFHSTVELKHNNSASSIRVDYFSKCGGTTLKKTNKCEGIANGQEVEFDIQITLDECPENPAEWRQEIEIRQVGLDESMIVVVEMDFGCSSCD